MHARNRLNSIEFEKNQMLKMIIIQSFHLCFHLSQLKKNLVSCQPSQMLSFKHMNKCYQKYNNCREIHNDCFMFSIKTSYDGILNHIRVFCLVTSVKKIGAHTLYGTEIEPKKTKANKLNK